MLSRKGVVSKLGNFLDSCHSSDADVDQFEDARDSAKK